MSLEDDIEKAKAGNASPVWNQTRAAAEESQRRNPTSGVWSDRRRSAGYPFFLAKNKSVHAVVLSAPKIVIGHKFTIGWNTVGGKSFPDTWYGPCSKWKLPDDPSVSGFEGTNQPCPACKVLGEPRTVLVLGLAVNEKYTHKQTGKTTNWQVKPLIVDYAGTINQMHDLAATQPDGDLRFKVLKISRSNNDRSPRIGDSFTVTKAVDPASVRGNAEITNAWKNLKFDHAWRLMTVDEMKQALTLHKQLCDRHMEGQGYDPKALIAVLRGDLAEDSDIASSIDDLGDSVPSGDTSLDGLADLPEGNAKPVEASVESFDDLTADIKPGQQTSKPAADNSDPWAT